jgi:glycosyltransferase involved in cell wall biosynthesis
MVTYTKRHLPTPIGLSGACPDLFRGRKSVHFVSPAWTYHRSDIQEIASCWRSTMQILPDATIIFLASTEYEATKLSEAGVPTAVCNVAIFVDEHVFQPLEPASFAEAEFDAIYNARLEPYKRHALAADVERLALIWDRRFDGTSSPYDREVAVSLSDARCLNLEFGAGEYHAFMPQEVARQLARARCGLCLSAEEGVMRASMEYLLCGLPIVTTKNKGGRDRYYGDPYVVFAEDEPAAVAAAVREINGRNLNKFAIRNHIAQLVDFERRNFLRLANDLVLAQFGIVNLFSSLRPFIECFPFVEPLSNWSRVRLLPLAQLVGRDLPSMKSQCK